MKLVQYWLTFLAMGRIIGLMGMKLKQNCRSLSNLLNIYEKISEISNRHSNYGNF
jgi:hypothetical protein